MPVEIRRIPPFARNTTLADLDLFREMDQYGLMMLGQPFGKSDFAESAELQRAVKTPVCFDESIEMAADALRAAQLGAGKIVNITATDWGLPGSISNRGVLHAKQSGAVDGDHAGAWYRQRPGLDVRGPSRMYL